MNINIHNIIILSLLISKNNFNASKMKILLYIYKLTKFGFKKKIKTFICNNCYYNFIFIIMDLH